jgi:hypothetical protein
MSWPSNVRPRNITQKQPVPSQVPESPLIEKIVPKGTARLKIAVTPGAAAMVTDLVIAIELSYEVVTV